MEHHRTERDVLLYHGFLRGEHIAVAAKALRVTVHCRVATRGVPYNALISDSNAQGSRPDPASPLPSASVRAA